MYKLAIFDFDGTLVDSAPGIVDVMRQVVDEYGFPTGILETWQNLVGVPLAKQMEIILPGADAEYHLEVADRYRAIYDVQAIEICPPFPALFTMLQVLRDEKVTVTIASSKRRHLIDAVLEHHQIDTYFSLVVGASDVTNHKPHPESVHHTVEKLRFAPRDVVVIGDSTYDLEMAHNAGVDSIGVTTGIHSHEILASTSPRHIVRNLEEVLPIIIG